MNTLKVLLLTALGVVHGTDSPPAADSWGPFQSRRIVSASGANYATLRSSGGYRPGPFALYRRRAGAPPIEPKRGGVWGGVQDKRGQSAIAADKQDELIVAGKLPQLPMDAAVSDAPLGIVLFDQYARVGSGNTLMFVDATGATAWSITLAQLFGEKAPAGSVHTVSSTWWSRAWGIDPGRQSAWVLTNGHEFREVTLADGTIGTPTPDVIARWCAGGTTKNRALVLDAIVLRGVTPEFAELLAPIAADVKAPLAVRLRSAVAARRAGDRVDHTEMFKAALRDPDPKIAAYAGAHLHEFSTNDAKAGLRTMLETCSKELDPREPAFPSHGPVVEANLVDSVRELGDPGLELLHDLCGDETLSLHSRLNAAALLSMLGEKRATQNLLTLCRVTAAAGTRPMGLGYANRAINLLIWRDPADLREQLVALLETGSGDDGRIGLHFKQQPWSGATAALRKALDRTPRGDDARRWLEQGVTSCRRAVK